MNISMQVAVWDTYVRRRDGRVMHFDIIVPSEMRNAETIYNFGKEYLASKAEVAEGISSNECVFCHIEKATEEMMASIRARGYYIVELNNC